MKPLSFVPLLLGAALLCACQPVTNAMGFDKLLHFTGSEAEQVTYRFSDSSVPPRYHRSYSILLTAQTLSITVDSYGDIVAQQELPSSPEQLQSLLVLLDEARIRKGQTPKETACTGGTGDRISAQSQGKQLFNAYRYNCSGDSGPLKGDVDAVKQHLQNLIPDFENLLKIGAEPKS